MPARAPSSSHRSAGLARLLILANCQTRACSGLSFLSTGPLDARQNIPRPPAPLLRNNDSHLLRPSTSFSLCLPARSPFTLAVPWAGLPPYSPVSASLHPSSESYSFHTHTPLCDLSNFRASHRYAHATAPPQDTVVICLTPDNSFVASSHWRPRPLT